MGQNWICVCGWAPPGLVLTFLSQIPTRGVCVSHLLRLEKKPGKPCCPPGVLGSFIIAPLVNLSWHRVPIWLSSKCTGQFNSGAFNTEDWPSLWCLHRTVAPFHSTPILRGQVEQLVPRTGMQDHSWPTHKPCWAWVSNDGGASSLQGRWMLLWPGGPHCPCCCPEQ